MREQDEQRNLEQITLLLRRFEIPLLQFATRILQDRDRARDVVQETFVKFQRNGAPLHGGQPATWLFKVCRNAALNVWRKEKRMTLLGEEQIESPADGQPLPFERMEQEEASGFLLRIITTLPPRQQEVLQLKFQDDLSYQQIAEITNTTPNNVGVLIHTALKTLRRRYSTSSKDFLSFRPRTSDK
jgi:RNA polymerase sigma factor (sigma-70 family)